MNSGVRRAAGVVEVGAGVAALDEAVEVDADGAAAAAVAVVML